MLRFVKHKNIDKDRWDACIEQSSSGLLYGYSWWLDIVSPKWDALIEGDYQRVFPLTINRSRWYKRLLQPLYTQRLDVFSKTPMEAKDYLPFFAYIHKKYKNVDICLQLDISLANNPLQQTLKERQTLNLQKDYQEISGVYNSSLKTNLNRAKKNNLSIVQNIDTRHIVDFMKKLLQKKSIRYHYFQLKKLKQIIKTVVDKGIGYTMGVADAQGKIITACLLIESLGVLYAFPWSLEEGKSLRSHYFLVDYLIKQYAGKPVQYDFMGSSIPGVKHTNESFGGETSFYTQLTK